MSETEILYTILCGIVAYLIGSISPAIIISNHFIKRDIRDFGSGNAGTSNVMRSFGWKLGLLTFGLDVFKGFAVVFATYTFVGVFPAIIASFCVGLGQILPIYYMFRGGKGIAVFGGVALAWMPIPTLIVFGIAVVIIVTVRKVSIASILGTILLIPTAWIYFNGDIQICLMFVGIAALALITHRENIKRLIAGNENKLNFSRIRRKTEIMDKNIEKMHRAAHNNEIDPSEITTELTESDNENVS